MGSDTIRFDWRISKAFGMGNLKNKNSANNRRTKYEKTGRGKVIMRVQLSKSDDVQMWEDIKKGLVEKYGSAKEGIFQLAKKDKII